MNQQRYVQRHVPRFSIRVPRLQERAETKRHPAHGAGFTLIESIMYLGLFSILFSGAVITALNVVEASGRNETSIKLTDEGNFLLTKMRWVLKGVQFIEVPAIQTTDSTLTVKKITGYDADNNPIETKITIKAADTNLVLSYPEDPEPNSFILNDSGANVSNLIFEHILETGTGMAPESLRASFTLTELTPNGATLSRYFSTTQYVKK